MGVLTSPVTFLAYHAYTMFLFTLADMKTIQVPITIFAAMAAPKTSLSHFAHAFFWTWLNLLQFTLANQSLNPAEDARNKPNRPIPSGRLTQAQARTLRWTVLLLCLALSYYHNILSVGVFFALGTYLYNEMKYDHHPFTKNFLNAFGYATFDYGATIIARADGNQYMDANQLVAHYLSTLIVFTTVHAQDFRDVVGDVIEGRSTVPIAFPSLSRFLMPVSLLGWSIGLSAKYYPSTTNTIALLLTSVITGWRFWYLRSAESDRRSYVLYNIWLSLARIVPMFSTSPGGMASLNSGASNSSVAVEYFGHLREFL